MRTLHRCFCYLWTSPNTLLGLLLVVAGLATGGRARVRAGVVEAHGGVVRWGLVKLTPFPAGAAAITLGHVVLGTSADTLERSRAHERVHVRQYERWGPLFLPAYGLASLSAWLRYGRPYRDNRFEREAYGE